jgi:predicted ATP-grasp superfamily ATP-dependent carboligase/thioredoxin reductase
MRRDQSEAGELDALVIDAAQRQALVAVRELGKAGLRVGAAECAPGAPAFASRWCGSAAILPDFAAHEDAFLDALLALCGARRPRVLIPSHDGSIEALRQRRAELEQVAGLALASERALAIAMDKPRTLQAARELGLRVPHGVLVDEAAQLPGALAEVGLPAVIKPARPWARGRQGGVRLNAIAATTHDAARAAIEAILASGVGAILQEWLPGEREAVSFLYADGRVWARFAQRTTRAVPPLGGSSVARESIPLPADIATEAERLVCALELEGYSEVEFRRDARGRAALMEINPRLSATVELAVRAGVPFPGLLHSWASGERLREHDGYRSGVHMRWLGGDLSWLKKVLATQGQPDSPARGRAVGAFLADFARPCGYDYLDVRDPRPALVASTGAVRRLRTRGAGVRVATAAGLDTEVAVIGAGPYGLSIAAHLRARGIDHEIFGEPMDTWSNHMPRGMCLKSEGFASNLSDPRGECTLGRFCAEEGLEYGDVGVPVALDTFERYGRAFQARFVPGLRRQQVGRVRALGAGFELDLDGGQALRARRVVVASGLQGHAYLPPELRGLPEGGVAHSFQQRDPALWSGLRVAVVGAGQSALDAAVLLHEQGAEVTVLARTPQLVWNADPVLGRRPLRARMRYPSSGLGEGLRLRLYASHPLIVHAAPAHRRLRVAYTALGPAGAWWLRGRFEGRVQALLGRTVHAVQPAGEELRLQLRGTGGVEQLMVARVLAGTGFRVDLSRLSFLDSALRAGIATATGAPVLDRSFQSSAAGLHFVGFLAAASFGPVMRFAYGADFTARRLARSLA